MKKFVKILLAVKVMEVFIGTSGYQFEDWFGTVYPESLRRKDVLEYYSHELGFNCVELNYTYYRLPSFFTSRAIVKKVPEGFKFAVRSYREMTHDIWEDEERKKIKDTSEIFDLFIEGILPLKEEGKLGPVLLQFPYSFWPSEETLRYLEFCKEKLSDFDVVVEFRNRAWVKRDIFDFLKKFNLGYCIVDEPKIRGLHPLVPALTSKTGYIRLHGRNPRWFEAEKEERYNYFYNEQELREVLSKVKKVFEEAEKTYIFFNNCTGGSALKNALMLKRILGLLKDLNSAQKKALSMP